MNPSAFPEQTGVLTGDPVNWGKDIGIYAAVPVHMFHGDARGRMCCCWKLTWLERVQVLFTGRIWHVMVTYGQPVPPQYLSPIKPYMENLHG